MIIDTENQNFLNKLIEKTIGAFRHIVEAHANKIPVGFTVVFYEPHGENKWFFKQMVVIDSHTPINQKMKGRIELVNQFLAEGIKRIMDGQHDDMMPENMDGDLWQIPGLKGKS